MLHEVGSLGNELLRAGAHATVNGVMSWASGGSFWSGFAIGGLSSLAGSGAQSLGLGGDWVPLISGATGAGAAWATDGDPLGGFMQGYSIGALNHKGDKIIGDDGKTYELSFDDVEIWGRGPICVDNTWTAMSHYLFGGGSSVYIGDNTLNALRNSPEFQRRHQDFIMGKNGGNYNGTFSVDMTNSVFHIGRTNVNYKLELINGQSKLTYDAFVNDGFWDPDFIDERYGRYFGVPDGFRPDGMGINLERFGR